MGTNLFQAMFIKAIASGTNFSAANLEQAQFSKASCVGTRFNDAQLKYVDFSHADLTGADFSGASMFRARFHGTKEDGTIRGNRMFALGDDEKLAEAENFKSPY